MDPEGDGARPVTLPVKVGVEVQATSLSGHTHKCIISAACIGISSGNWYCVTHDEHFATNDHKHVHCLKPGTHVMAWNCNTHGLEVP